MSYASVETSAFSGMRVSLYLVQIGETLWRFTDNAEVISYDSALWQPLAGIQHDMIPNAIDLDAGQVRLRLPFEHELCQLFKLGCPGSDLGLVIYHGHATGEFIVKWVGRLVDFAVALPFGELVSESIYTSARRYATGQIVSSTCQTDLYSPQCKINKEIFKLDAVITAISGLTITAAAIASKPDNWFVGGYVVWQHPDYDDIIMQASVQSNDQSDSSITIAMPAPTLAVGTAITIYPGCNKEYAGDCASKFNNQINFRGLPFLNNRNPFAGFRLF